MGKTIKKYGKHVASFALLALVFGLPLVAGASTNYLNEFNTGAGYQNGGTSLATIIGKAVNAILGFLGVLLILYIIWAGWTWMSAGGDDKKVATAQTRIKNAVIGMIIIFAAYAITNFVISNLNTVTGQSVQTGS